MPTNNPWLNPYQRSFNSIKEQLKVSLRENVPEITDYSEGNIFIIIISIFSAIAEVLHYYIDNMARETFFATARRYSSLYKHAKLVDYHIKSAIPATVDLVLYTKNGQDLTTSFTIPFGTQFVSDDSKVWEVANSAGIYWDKELYPKSIVVPVVQKESVGRSSRINFGQIIDYGNLAIAVTGIPEGKLYVEGSMVLYVDNQVWTLVDTFAYSGPSDQHYKVELDGNLVPTIIFGDGKNGTLPVLGGQVTGYFEVTYGEKGNIGAGTFNNMPSIGGVDVSNIAVTNYNAASGGSDYEDFSMLKEHVPLSVKTLGVAITKEDFEAAAMLVGGVNKAYAEYICGKQVNIYITPDNGEVEASASLCQQVTAQLNKQKVITTAITVLPVYRAYIYIDADIYGKKSFLASDIKAQIVTALQNFYGFQNAELGRAVRVSDVYATIDNIQTIDYLTLNKLYVIPKPILVSGSPASPELILNTFNQVSYAIGSASVDVYITFTSQTVYTLQVGNASVNGTTGSSLHVVTDDLEFYITVGAAAYNTNTTYWFYLSPMNENISTRDDAGYKAIPIFINRSDTLKLNIHESV